MAESPTPTPTLRQPPSSTVDVYVTEVHPHYQVWADGQIIEHLTVRTGPPLTWSEQYDVAANYRDAIVSGVLRLPRPSAR